MIKHRFKYNNNMIIIEYSFRAVAEATVLYLVKPKILI